MNDKTGKKSHSAAGRKNAKVIEQAVSGRLKAYYDEMTRQEVPDRFLDLLKRLDESTTKSDR